MKVDLTKITTEGRNQNTLDIDKLDTLSILKKLNDEDYLAAIKYLVKDNRYDFIENKAKSMPSLGSLSEEDEDDDNVVDSDSPKKETKPRVNKSKDQ